MLDCPRRYSWFWLDGASAGGPAKQPGRGRRFCGKSESTEQAAKLTYDISSSEIYGETRPQPIVIGSDVPDAPLLIDLRYTIEHCGAESQPAIIAAVSQMGPLCSALGSIAERAQEEGWYRRSIDETIQLATARCLSFATDELIHLRPPGGEIPPWM